MGIIIVVIMIVIGIMIFSIQSEDISNKSEEWISSGPFSIDKQQYLLGENIFLIATALQTTEKGEIQFIRTSGDIYRSIPFDGSLRSDFNQYFTPFPSSTLKICTSDDLVGEWTVKFQGTDYKPIMFEIINEYLEGEEYKFVDDCK